MPRGKFQVTQDHYNNYENAENTNISNLDQYDTTTPQEDTSYDVGEETPSQDPIKLEEYNSTAQPKMISLNGSNTVPASDIVEGDDNKTTAGKFFGFIRNRFDEVTDDLKAKKEAKAQAYNQWLKQRPNIYQEQYLKQFQNSALPGNDRFSELLKNISSGAKQIGSSLGGNISPDRVMGFKGTILGPLPTGGNTILQQMQMTPQQQYPGTVPNMYQQPGMVGSQVPRYSAAPQNAQPGSQWARVVKIDRYGKKRSYLRKMTMPGQQSQLQPMSNTMQQNINPMQMTMPNPMGVKYSQENMDSLARLDSGINLEDFARSNSKSGISMDNLINDVKIKANFSKQTAFNPDNYLK